MLQWFSFATTGRFLTRDPYPAYAAPPTAGGTPSTLHRYVYVGNNPISRVDPSGLRWAGAAHLARTRSLGRWASMLEGLGGGGAIGGPSKAGRLSYRPGYGSAEAARSVPQGHGGIVRIGHTSVPSPGPLNYQGPTYNLNRGRGGGRGQASIRSYDQTGEAQGRKNALNRITGDLMGSGTCAPTGTPDKGFFEGLLDNLKPGQILPYLANEVRTNPFWHQRISPQEGLKVALWAGLAVGATVLTGGAAAPFVLAGAALSAGAAYGSQVHANYQAGMRGAEMWRGDLLNVMRAGFQGMGMGAIAGLAAPVIGAVAPMLPAPMIYGATGAVSQVLGQGLEDVVTRGWGNWSSPEVYRQQAIAGAVGGVVGGAVGGLTRGLGPVISGALTGAATGAATQLTVNALSRRPLGEGVLMAAGVGFAGGGMAGGVIGAMGPKVPTAVRMVAGALVGGGVSAGVQVAMNVASGLPPSEWFEGWGLAFGVGFGSGLIDATLDYWGDTAVGGAVPADEDGMLFLPGEQRRWVNYAYEVEWHPKRLVPIGDDQPRLKSAADLDSLKSRRGSIQERIHPRHPTDPDVWWDPVAG